MRAVLRRLVASRVARLVATATFLGVVLWRSQPQRLLPAASALGAGSLLLALVLTVPFLYLKALRWQYMLRNAGSDVTFAEAGVSLIGGMGLALLTPARLGELARIAYLRDPRKLRLSGLVLLDKVFDVVVLAGLSAIGAWRIVGAPLGVALGAATLVGLLFLYRPELVGRLWPARARMPSGRRVQQVLSSLESLSPTATTLYIAITLAAFAIVILQFGVILHTPLSARHSSVSLRIALYTFPLVILTNIVPLTIAGLGVREGAAALLLGHFHVAASVAVISAFMMFFLNTALPGILGAMLLPLLRPGAARDSQRPATSAIDEHG